MLLFIKTKKKKKKTEINNKKKQTKTKQTKKVTTCLHCLHHWWRCYHAIALNDLQVGPTSLAPLSPQLNDATQ